MVALTPAVPFCSVRTGANFFEQAQVKASVQEAPRDVAVDAVRRKDGFEYHK